MFNAYEWCSICYGSGSVIHSRKHTFKKYYTLFRKREMYHCLCGIKISPAEYDKYIEIMVRRDEKVSEYLRGM